MKITRILAYRVELAPARGHLQMVRRQVGLRVRLARSWPSRRRGHHRLRRGLPAGAVLSAGLCQGGADRDRRAGAASARRRPERARQAEPPDGRRPQGPSLRQVGHRHRLLGHPRQGGGPAGLRAAGRPVRRRLRPLSRDLAGIPGGDGPARGRLSRRGLSPVPVQGRRRPDGRHRAHPGRRGGAAARAIDSSPTPTPAG